MNPSFDPSEVEEELSQLLDEAPSEPGLDDEDVEDLLRNTRDRITRDQGWRGWLRTRSTGARLTTGLVLVGGITVAALARTSKPLDATLMAHVAVLASLAALAVVLGLRPLQARPLSTPAMLSLLGLLLLVPIGLSFDTGAAASVSLGEQFRAMAKCFVVGSLFAVPLALLVGALSRGSNLLASVALAGAAGLGANLWLEAHCPVPGTLHMLGGHVAIIAVYALLTAVSLRFLGPGRRPSRSA